MQVLTLDAQRFSSSCNVERAELALCGVIGSVGDDAFGQVALEQLNRWMPFCWLSVYRLFDDAPPTMYTSGSHGVPDGTRESWRVYRAGLYRGDDTFAIARERVRAGQAVVMHWNAREMRPRHREAIYSRHHVRERLSLVAESDEQSLLAVNLYRHDEQASFSDEAIEAIGRLGRPLLTCVTRHLALDRRASAAGALPAAFEALTGREVEVCLRLLKGWTYEGIAADLQLSTGTVKTYRDRAFERLKIHHRNELFALARQGELAG